jgi:NAD(P) transhydrogenase subunit alpha
MVGRMRPGSVLVDLAADSGGNCELSRPGEQIVHHGVLVWGGRNVPSQLAAHASRLYAANMAAFILAMCRDGVLLSGPEEIDSDEIAAACCVLVKGEFR